MPKVQTVRIKHGKGEKVINKADYDEKEHGKILPDPKPKEEPKKAESNDQKGE